MDEDGGSEGCAGSAFRVKERQKSYAAVEANRQPRSRLTHFYP